MLHGSGVRKHGGGVVALGVGLCCKLKGLCFLAERLCLVVLGLFYLMAGYVSYCMVVLHGGRVVFHERWLCCLVR